MTKEEKYDAVCMRDQGITYTEIGIKYGLSRQRIKQIIDAEKREKKDDIVFPELYMWIKENRKSISSFSEELGISGATLYRYLHGKASPTLNMMRKIEELSGKDITYLFRLK